MASSVAFPKFRCFLIISYFTFFPFFLQNLIFLLIYIQQSPLFLSLVSYFFCSVFYNQYKITKDKIFYWFNIKSFSTGTIFSIYPILNGAGFRCFSYFSTPLFFICGQIFSIHYYHDYLALFIFPFL